jgi:hypothetical protein
MVAEADKSEAGAPDPLERLSVHLYETMERLDPSDEITRWGALRPAQQEFYRSCVRELMAESLALQAARSLDWRSPTTTR